VFSVDLHFQIPVLPIIVIAVVAVALIAFERWLFVVGAVELLPDWIFLNIAIAVVIWLSYLVVLGIYNFGKSGDTHTGFDAVCAVAFVASVVVFLGKVEDKISFRKKLLISLPLIVLGYLLVIPAEATHDDFALVLGLTPAMLGGLMLIYPRIIKSS
jgi:hypothetical protein